MKAGSTLWVGMFALSTVASCRSSAGTVLTVTVTASGALPNIAGLDVTLIGAQGTSENLYGGAGQSIAFPTTFAADVPRSIAGDFTLDVKAVDAEARTVAQGRTGPFTVHPGQAQELLVRLDCIDNACGADGGQSDGGGLDAASDVQDPNCGNGRIDIGETCDIAIAPDAPGHCPAAGCDDGIPCTIDTLVGQACQARCVYKEITTQVNGDGCCPAGATAAEDSDCSATCGDGVVDVGETCDTAISAGTPGACPSAAECNDHDPCMIDALISAGTCDAICAHVPITVQSGAELDGCCPAGAWHAVDADCPSFCGDGRFDTGELCDPGLPPSSLHACPTTCDDGDPCTVDAREGAGCQTHCVHSTITALIAGDGCCPVGANHDTDSDCRPSCGNDVVEPGESCDGMPGTPHACPTTCDPSPSACLMNELVGNAGACTARCELRQVTACGVRDGCCADGCTAATDPDCSPTCGDGVVQSANGETCDTAIARGVAGACPTSCSDGKPCSQGFLVGAGTCQATCVFVPITAARAGDGCCPSGANAVLDPDCAPICGNGVVEPPSETCDYAAGAGACPSTCPAGGSCTPIRLEGTLGTCTAACVAHPIGACIPGDGCCPGWCTIANDSDCPAICGDAVLTQGETCDRAITAGLAGACAATCDDGDACTTDWASGAVEGCSRACSHAPITACRTGDGCCPAGCTAATDHDCAPICGDGLLEAGETCDPPQTCPTTCPDDGDPCTRAVLVGDAAHCNVACLHIPVTSCSGRTADFCCPTTCTPTTDVDCPVQGPE
jgi:hypothetical protein